jgi:8-oxo-dGTP pyrophosphatase MutT (NUDIX family)
MDKTVREIKLSRGVLIKNEKILLVQDVRPGQGHFFLPGGNVEPGESIRGTLSREWHEELGWEVKPGGFLGCLEHKWSYSRKQDGSLVEIIEVNFLFTVKVSEQEIQKDLLSREAHLKFSWISISELKSIKLFPEPLKELIPQLAENPPSSIWISTLE